jgi:hypothetical protein
MMNSRLTELHPARGIRDSNALAGMSPQCWISIRPRCGRRYSNSNRMQPRKKKESSSNWRKPINGTKDSRRPFRIWISRDIVDVR